MRNFQELQLLMSLNSVLVWNDPNPIEENDYTITKVEMVTYYTTLDDEAQQDLPIHITYGNGSVADVLLSEIELVHINLTIQSDRFLDWYYDYGQDQENEESRLRLANSIISQMYGAGQGSMSVNEIFDGCNQEAIRLYFTNEFDMLTDVYDIEISDLQCNFEITLK